MAFKTPRILERFGDIMAANIEDLLDRCEDPAKTVDQCLRKMRTELADVKDGTTDVMAAATEAKAALKAIDDDISQYDTAINNALLAGNDGDAEKLEVKLQTLKATRIESAKVYQLAEDNATKMRQMHDQLVREIAVAESRRDMVKGKASVAKAQETVNRVSGGTGVAQSAGTKLTEMENRVDRQLNKAMAMAELNAVPVDETVDLVNKYGGTSQVSISDSIAARKRALGLVKPESSQSE